MRLSKQINSTIINYDIICVPISSICYSFKPPTLNMHAYAQFWFSRRCSKFKIIRFNFQTTERLLDLKANKKINSGVFRLSFEAVYFYIIKLLVICQYLIRHRVEFQFNKLCTFSCNPFYQGVGKLIRFNLAI